MSTVSNVIIPILSKKGWFFMSEYPWNKTNITFILLSSLYTSLPNMLTPPVNCAQTTFNQIFLRIFQAAAWKFCCYVLLPLTKLQLKYVPRKANRVSASLLQFWYTDQAQRFTCSQSTIETLQKVWDLFNVNSKDIVMMQLTSCWIWTGKYLLEHKVMIKHG